MAAKNFYFLSEIQANNMFKLMKSWLAKFFRKPKDPVKVLPKAAMDLVLGFLNANELVKCTTINRDWNKFIGKSERCMDKIKFCVAEPGGMTWKFTESDANRLLLHGRKYKHIALYVSRSMTKDHLMLMASSEWRTVMICHHTFKSEIELASFLGLIEPFVEELDLRYVKVVTKHSQIMNTDFQFPRLKKLKLSFCYGRVHAIFKNVESLSEFEIETGPITSYESAEREVHERVRSTQIMLLQNWKLKKLSLFITQKDFDKMFADRHFVVRIGFQLESLRTRKFKKTVAGEVVQLENFADFLKTQQNTMLSMCLADWLGNDILEIVINAMDKMKYLIISDLHSYGKLGESIANLNFWKNEAIESLVIIAVNAKDNTLQNSIFGYVPNLKHLSIGVLDQKILGILIEKTPHLETIDVDYFTAYFPPDRPVLTHLKKIKINISFTRTFRDILRDYKNYTTFEKAFLKAIIK